MFCLQIIKFLKEHISNMAHTLLHSMVQLTVFHSEYIRGGLVSDIPYCIQALWVARIQYYNQDKSS